MIIRHANVYWPDYHFALGDLVIREGRIVDAPPLPQAGETVLEAGGRYALPGLVDIHLHGAAGWDISDADGAGLETMAAFEAGRGVLAVCPAAMTLPEERLGQIMDAAAAYRSGRGADLVGVRLEGPFLAPARARAQNRDYLRRADAGLLLRLRERSGGRLRLVDIAPETPGALACIRACRGALRFSLGHTCAGYEEVLAALDAGAGQLTHLYNAMPSIHHREPGPVVAALEAGALVELIADGVHVHPAMVRLTFRLFGADRVILISDSMRACGLPDGDYTLGGQDVTVKGRRAVLRDRPETIAGSVTDLYTCMRRAALEMGVPLTWAVQAASENPARAIGIEADYGSLAPGRWGNVVLADAALEIWQVIRHGEAIS